MAFDLSTAKPANQPLPSGGFDMSTAKPVKTEKFDTASAVPVAAPVKQTKDRTGLDYAEHVAGVGARGVVKGIASIPDLPFNTINLAELGMSKLTGKDPEYLPTPFTSGAEWLMEKGGYPTAETENEKILETGLSGLSGGAITGPVGAASGAMGGAGSQIAANEGAGPVVQAAVGLVSGMAPALAFGLTRSAGRAVLDTVKPDSDANVGRVFAAPLRKPGEVLDMLKRGPDEYVPGSIPTTAETAMDNDLIASQQSFLNTNPKYKGDLQNRNVAAQNEYIDDIAKTPADLASAEASRSAKTQPLYEAAKSSLTDQKAIEPILARIDDAIAGVGTASEAGQRLLSLKQKIQDSMPRMVENKSPILDASGSPISAPKFENPQQGPLIQIYKEQRDAAAKTGMQEGSYGASVKGVVKPVIREFGDALEGQNPDLKAANAVYRDMSGPIDQMTELQSIKERVFKGGRNISGDQAPRLPALDGILSNEGREDLVKILTPEQMERLDNLHADLKRQSTLSSVKSSGSDTSSLRKADKLKGDVASSFINYGLGKIPLIGGLFKSFGSRVEMRGEKLLDDALGRAYTDVPYAAEVLEAGMKSPETIRGQLINTLKPAAKGTALAAMPKDLASQLETDKKKKQPDAMFQ